MEVMAKAAEQCETSRKLLAQLRHTRTNKGTDTRSREAVAGALSPRKRTTGVRELAASAGLTVSDEVTAKPRTAHPNVVSSGYTGPLMYRNVGDVWQVEIGDNPPRRLDDLSPSELTRLFDDIDPESHFGGVIKSALVEASEREGVAAVWREGRSIHGEFAARGAVSFAVHDAGAHAIGSIERDRLGRWSAVGGGERQQLSELPPKPLKAIAALARDAGFSGLAHRSERLSKPDRLARRGLTVLEGRSIRRVTVEEDELVVHTKHGPYAGISEGEDGLIFGGGGVMTAEIDELCLRDLRELERVLSGMTVFAQQLDPAITRVLDVVRDERVRVEAGTRE